MGQTRSTNHQGQGVHKHVECAACRGGGVLAKSEVGDHGVQLGQQGHVRTAQVTAQTQLRQEVARELQGDEHCRHGVSQNQHNVLSHLRVGDALHAAKHGVQEHDAHTHVNTHVTGDSQEARERHTHTGHLTNDVSDGGGQQADHSDHRSALGVEAVTNELRHGKFTELAQVGRQQHGQQHVAASPTHQEQRAAVTHVGDQAGHGDEGSGRHPVGTRGHAVHDRVDVTARRIKLTGGTGTRPDGNADVERKAQTHHDVDCGLKIHVLVLSLHGHQT